MTTPIFDPHTATLEQCCDYIAECKYGDGPYVSENGRVMRWIERVPPTLDSIDGSLPDDVSVIFVAGPKPEWICTFGIGSGYVKTWITASADTELLARARCVALALKTVKEGKR